MLEIYKVDKHLLPEGGIEEMMLVIMKLKGYDGLIQFGYNNYQKPYLKDYPDIHFNGSHSGEYLVCALSDVPVGIDIQKIDTDMDILRLAERFMSAAEAKYLGNLDPERRGAAFYRLWAQNEAYMKYTGLGFALPMSEFTIREEDAAPVVIQNDTPIDDITLLPVPIEKGYEGWVCGEYNDREAKVITLTEQDFM